MIACIFLLASWLLPAHFPPWVSWHSEALAFAGVLALCWQALLAKVKHGSRSPFEFPSAVWLPLALLVVVLVQGATQQIEFAGDAFVMALYLMLCIVALGLGYGLKPAQTPVLPTLAASILLAALASGIIAFVQVFDVWDQVSWVHRMPYARRPGANLGQPNLLATLLLLGFVSLMYLYERQRLGSLVFGLSSVVLICALAVAESRTSLLSFACIVFWWGLKKSSLKPRISFLVLATIAIFFIAAYYTWPWALSHLQYVGAGATVDSQAGLRLLVWQQLLEAILQQPVWGWGLREVSKAHNAVLNLQPVTEAYTYSHNLTLDLALGMGLPLTAVALSATAFWCWRKLRAVADMDGWYCMAALIPVAVHSMLEFPFAYAFFLAPVFFLVGQLERLYPGKVAFRVGVKPALVALGVTSMLAAISVWEYLKVEEDFRIVRFESLGLGRTPNDYERPSIHLLTQLDALLNAGRLRPHPGMAPEDIELARTVALRFPWPATQNRYAMSLALNDQPAEAERQLRIMRAMHTERNFSSIRENWLQLAQEKYPELRRIALP